MTEADIKKMKQVAAIVSKIEMDASDWSPLDPKERLLLKKILGGGTWVSDDGQALLDTLQGALGLPLVQFYQAYHWNTIPWPDDWPYPDKRARSNPWGDAPKRSKKEVTKIQAILTEIRKDPRIAAAFEEWQGAGYGYRYWIELAPGWVMDSGAYSGSADTAEELYEYLGNIYRENPRAPKGNTLTIPQLRQAFIEQYRNRDALFKEQTTGQLTAGTMEEVAWELGYEHESFERALERFLPLAQALGADIVGEYERGQADGGSVPRDNPKESAAVQGQRLINQLLQEIQRAESLMAQAGGASTSGIDLTEEGTGDENIDRLIEYQQFAYEWHPEIFKQSAAGKKERQRIERAIQGVAAIADRFAGYVADGWIMDGFEWIDPDRWARIQARENPATHIQSLLFSRAHGWTKTTAQAWAHQHGYHSENSRMDITEHYVRIRQVEPSREKKGSFRTIELSEGKGIKAVIAKKK